MAKKLMINCAMCDARNLKEETLRAYEQITINCAEILVTPQTKVLLNSYGVAMNCSKVRELASEVQLRTVNGKALIRSTDQISGKMFLQVNGSLEIGPGTREVLEQYAGICVNGKVRYPQSLSGSLGMLDVNGAAVAYPDDAVVLKKNAVIDKTFPLRAKQRQYWSEKRIIITDPKLDAAALAAKGAFFTAEEVILAEAFAEPLIDQIDEQAELMIVPDGTAVVTDDLKLDQLAVEKYGNKLYILGDLDLDQEDREALAQMEYLNVRGDAKVPGELKELLLKKLTALEGELKIKKGRYISDQISVRISKAMLEQELEGIQVEACVTVVLDADIPGNLILERLQLRDCVTVRCTPEQEAVLALICEDVVTIKTAGKQGLSEMIQSALGIGKELLDTRMINAAEYIL